jgi:hypothetical protein
MGIVDPWKDCASLGRDNFSLWPDPSLYLGFRSYGGNRIPNDGKGLRNTSALVENMYGASKKRHIGKWLVAAFAPSGR